jgi:hypothetical protein
MAKLHETEVGPIYDRIDTLVREAGSVKALSRKAGLYHGVIGRWARREGLPSIPHLLVLAKACKVSPGWIIDPS